MNEPGLTIAPPGPGWGSFLLTLALLAVSLWGFVHYAATLIDEGHLSEKRGPDASVSPAMNPEEKHRVNMALRARPGSQSDPEAGVMDRFTQWLPHRTDGETGPFWPWVVSRLAADDHPFQERAVMDEDYVLLHQGLWLHVWLAVILMAGIGLIVANSLSPPAALLMLLPAAYAALLPQAVLFRPDLLYYLLVFLSWLCALRLLRKNSVWMHGIFGILTGLAWLTDTTAWIVLAAWFFAASCRWLLDILQRKDTPADESWTSRNHFVGLVALIIGWVTVCGPRCGASMDRWGSPFFSWQQQWMWFDNTDRESLLNWARSHSTKEQLETIPESERPSLANYRRTHTPEQMKARLAGGWQKVWLDFVHPADGKLPEIAALQGANILSVRGIYPAGVLVILLGAGVLTMTRRKAVDREALEFPDGSLAAVLFTVAGVAGYGVWHAWNAAISPGGLAVLYLPMMFTLTKGAENLMVLARMRGAPRWSWRVYQVLMWLLLAAAAAGIFLAIRNS